MFPLYPVQCLHITLFHCTVCYKDNKDFSDFFKQSVVCIWKKGFSVWRNSSFILSKHFSPCMSCNHTINTASNVHLSHDAQYFLRREGRRDFLWQWAVSVCKLTKHCIQYELVASTIKVIVLLNAASSSNSSEVLCAWVLYSVSVAIFNLQL